MKLLARKILLTGVIMLASAPFIPAQAALDIGDAAPKFSAPAALAGKTFTFSLATAPTKGPWWFIFPGGILGRMLHRSTRLC